MSSDIVAWAVRNYSRVKRDGKSIKNGWLCVAKHLVFVMFFPTVNTLIQLAHPILFLTELYKQKN
jgi:hypothetical protein